VAESFEVFVPVGQARGHHDGNSAGRSLRDGDKVAVSSVGEAALAEDDADILLGEEVVALVEARGVQRAPAVLLQDGSERTAVVEIRRNDKDLRTIVHVVHPKECLYSDARRLNVVSNS